MSLSSFEEIVNITGYSRTVLETNQRERETEREMEEQKGVVKHVLLTKFKDGVPPDQIEQLIKGYANLVNLIEPMKSFPW